jgi:hypothetical protein
MICDFLPYETNRFASIIGSIAELKIGYTLFSMNASGKKPTVCWIFNQAETYLQRSFEELGRFDSD